MSTLRKRKISLVRHWWYLIKVKYLKGYECAYCGVSCCAYTCRFCHEFACDCGCDCPPPDWATVMLPLAPEYQKVLDDNMKDLLG